MKYKTGYQIDGWGRFICEIQIRENPRKAGHYPCSANTIFERPPKTKKYESAVWNGEQWKVTPDFMGHEFYNKKTAEKYEQKIELGDVIDLAEWTAEKPDGRFAWQYFNDIAGQWEENTVEKEKAKKQERLSEIKAELDRLDLKKIRFLLEKEKGDLSGEEDFQKREKETERLRAELKAIQNKRRCLDG